MTDSKMISLKKDGKIIYSREFGINPREVSSFLPFIAEPMEIEEGTTFETFFNHIMKEKAKYSKFFASHLGHFDLNMFEDEWRKPFCKEDDYDEMQYLEVYWHVDYDRSEGGVLNEQPEFHGMGISKEKESTAYGLDFTPLNKLKAYPLILNNEYAIEEYEPGNQQINKVFEGKKDFTVYDVISAVLYEITFYGAPEDRNKQLQELKRRVDEIDRGEAELIPMEDIKQFFENLDRQEE